MCFNIGNTVWYCYAGKVGTKAKSSKPNAGNAIGYGYSDKRDAFFKCPCIFIKFRKSIIRNFCYITAGKVKFNVFGFIVIKYVSGFKDKVFIDNVQLIGVCSGRGICGLG